MPVATKFRRLTLEDRLPKAGDIVQTSMVPGLNPLWRATCDGEIWVDAAGVEFIGAGLSEKIFSSPACEFEPHHIEWMKKRGEFIEIVDGQIKYRLRQTVARLENAHQIEYIKRADGGPVFVHSGEDPTRL